MRKFSILIIAIIAFVSCEEFENSAEKSKVTYLPVLTVNGENAVDLECNASGYTDEGAEAFEEGESLEVETVLTGQYFGGSLVGGEWVYDDNTTVDGADVYEYYYSAVNVDGIPAAAFRIVSVPACNDNLTEGIAGTYTSSLVRTITEDGSAAGTYTDVGPIIIKDLGGDVYQISDALGGWYDHGRAFGYTGAAPGVTITVNNLATNDFTFSGPVKDQTFGDLVTITDLVVDSGDGTLTFTAEWAAGYTFVYTLTQIE